MIFTWFEHRIVHEIAHSLHIVCTCFGHGVPTQELILYREADTVTNYICRGQQRSKTLQPNTQSRSDHCSKARKQYMGSEAGATHYSKARKLHKGGKAGATAAAN